MGRYYGNSALTVFIGFIGVALLILTLSATCQAVPQLASPDLLFLATGISLVLTVLGVGLSCLSNTGLLGASYLVDDRGITGWTLGRATTILWSDVDRFEEVLSIESGKRLRYNLYTADGRWIFIHVSSLTDGDRLCAHLEDYLAPLRKRASLEIAKSGRSWRPDCTAGLLLLGVVAPLFILGGLLPYELGWSGRVEDSQTFAPVLGAMCAAAGSVFAVLGAELISRVLTHQARVVQHRVPSARLSDSGERGLPAFVGDTEILTDIRSGWNRLA
jgi:hypothetical protein